MNIIDLIVFLIFTVGTIVFGYMFGRKKQSSDEFTRGGGKVPGWVVGLSIFASFCSSISFLGYCSSAFMGNWNAFVFTLSILPAGLLAMWYFVPFYRSLGSISAYSYFEKRFGRWARLYASVFYLFTQVCRSGAILFLLAVPMNVLMGWNIPIVVTITGLGIILYSQKGGLKSVIWTEALQGAILVGGAVICLIVLYWGMPEGPGQAIRICTEHNKFSLGSFEGSLVESTFWVCLIYGMFTNLNNFAIDQSYTQRYCAAPSLGEARKSAFWGSLLTLPVNLILFLIGSGLFAFYYINPGLLPEGIKSDFVFPYFIINEMPVGLVGLLIASIFCAGMSTVATSVTSSGTIILTDFYSHLFPNSSDERKVIVLRIASVMIGVLGIGVALCFLLVDNALDAWWALSSICSGGVLGMFLLAYLCPKAKKAHVVPGVIVGVASLILIALQTKLTDWWGLPTFVHINLSIVISTLLIFLIGFLLVQFINKKETK
ncbi:sodium:solute symporter [uncultured Duncaniella sp.]|uniref:sodium:solute symporter n=1 Tax=uncultured Duncaniella sp. TaxID=2768039 RepID=UPI0025FCFF91|nr:sodium:solute symporter [uncultured Duncaniella sp.]